MSNPIVISFYSGLETIDANIIFSASKCTSVSERTEKDSFDSSVSGEVSNHSHVVIATKKRRKFSGLKYLATESDPVTKCMKWLEESTSTLHDLPSSSIETNSLPVQHRQSSLDASESLISSWSSLEPDDRND